MQPSRHRLPLVTPAYLDQLHQRLQTLLQSLAPLAVAFSGGADSALLLKVALDTLGPGQVVALFARSPLLKEREIERVRHWAESNGYGATLVLETVEMQPLQWPAFTCNDVDRCYLCKHAIYQKFLERAAAHGLRMLADGTNSDDLLAHRPGRRAILELGIRTPLAEVGLTKDDVRHLGRHLGLSNWDHPSASCLATRIPTGVEISAARLRWIEQAEEIVMGLGIDDCRVQLLDETFETVVIHVNGTEFARLLQNEHRLAMVRALKEQGAGRVLLNLEGR